MKKKLFIGIAVAMTVFPSTAFAGCTTRSDASACVIVDLFFYEFALGTIKKETTCTNELTGISTTTFEEVECTGSGWIWN